MDDLSEQPVREIVHKVLKNDARKAFDNDAHTQFNATQLRAVPTSNNSTSAITLTSNGTATLTNSVARGIGHIKAITDAMKERNIPPYIQDDYVAIAWPTTFRGVKNGLETIHQYTEQGFTLIHNGEIGRYENVRFVEQTQIGKGVSNNGTAWTSALSDWAYFFGEDTVAEGIIIPEEMRGKIPSDYGRSRGIAWYALLGYGLTQTQVVQTRVLKWDSGA